ncbi:MAG: hypothetical protein J5747_11740 [Spirochaetaceae bacterium]|nr:hypothetical protein [Spirochaetaceae bacterium]
MKKALVVAVLFLAVLLACVGCSSEPKLQGTFVNDVYGTFVFDGNGNVTITNSGFSFSGTYTVSGNTVTVSINMMGTMETGTLTWSGNTLTDDETGDVYTKQ